MEYNHNIIKIKGNYKKDIFQYITRFICMIHLKSVKDVNGARIEKFKYS